MKLLICVLIAAAAATLVYAAGTYEPNQSGIVGPESQRMATQGQQNAQQEQQWRQSHPGYMYGAADANTARTKMRQMQQERMAELKRIRDLAASENATKTVAALDKFIAEEQQRQSMMQQRMRRGMEPNTPR
jgi:hypothetical protein